MDDHEEATGLELIAKSDQAACSEQVQQEPVNFKGIDRITLINLEQDDEQGNSQDIGRGSDPYQASEALRMMQMPHDEGADFGFRWSHS